MARFLRILLGVAALGVLASGQDIVKTVSQIIGKNYQYTQGPAWSKEGFLIFSDTATDTLWRWVPGGDAAPIRKPANGPSGNAFDSQGRLYTCETHARRVTRSNLKDGKLEVLADQFDGKKLNAPDDLAVSKSDHVYFTDPAFGSQQDHRELDFYGVYHLPPKGGLRLVAKPVGRPNGIAISPNGRLLYVTNSDEKNVRAYDIDRNGDTSGERVLIAGMAGVPGGIRVSDKGELYIATPKGIAIYSADGKSMRIIPMHDSPSSCAFDADGRTLYVTARGMVYRIRPEAGE